MNTLRQGTSAEIPLQASKWLSSQALLDADEMASLFDFLGPFFLYSSGAVKSVGEGGVDKSTFLANYRNYIDSLKSGVSPDPTFFRPLFSPAMTVTTDALYSVPVGNGKEVIRISRPVIQLQAHHMTYSTVDKKFHPMVFGMDSISWGIQFSYPQLYLDNATKEVENVKDTPAFPNTKLYQSLQKWMRQNTIPTPFIAENTPINVPMRLGKQCTSWINSHPHLVKKEITVKC